MNRTGFLSASLGVGAAFVVNCFAQAPLAPVIYAQPQSRTVPPGISVTLKVDADGYPALSYRWFRNGLPYPGSTNSSANSLWLMNSLTNAGGFQVVITNAFGVVTSDVAYVTVRSGAPSVRTEPSTRTVCSGSSASLGVWADGTIPLSFRWQQNGADLAGKSGVISTSSPGYLNLLISPVTVAGAGDYTLALSNALGVYTGAVATLTVDPPAPVLTQQPVSRATNIGVSVSLFVAATSCPPAVAYQWRSNGVHLAGATSSVVTFPSTTPALTAEYDVVVAGNNASVTSRTVWLVVTNWPPTLTCQPQSRTVWAGSNVSFTVCAAGGTPRTYLWRHNGEWLPTISNSPNYLIRYPMPEHAGDYDVIVTNIGGAVTSQVATLTVLVIAPTIFTNPASQTQGVGQTAHFNARASGAPPPAYQWRKDGSDLPGKTNTTLSLTNLTLADAGDYTVLAWNVAGAVTSAVARLTVTLGSPPTILGQPYNQTISLSYPTNALFHVWAGGTEPLFYQWFHGGAPILNATNAWLNIYPPTPADAGDYFAVVTNAVGVVTSEVARLTLIIEPPTSTDVWPRTATAQYGAPPQTYFYGWASGAQPLHYQWYSAWGPIAGATNSWLELGPIGTNDAGIYFFVVTNIVGAAASPVVTLTVIVDPPSILSGPSDRNFEPDALSGVNYLSVTAVGALPLDYQWFHNGQPVPLGTNYTLTFDNATTSDAGSYFVVVSNLVGMATSAVAQVTVGYVPPTIFGQSQDQTVFRGSQFRFCAVFTGSAPFNYQWQRFGTNIPDASGWSYSAYPITNVACYSAFATTNLAGDYQIVVTNLGGSVTSEVARLTVLPWLPSVTTNPVSQGAVAGGLVGFAAMCANGGLQWQFNGQNLSNTSNYTLWLTEVQTNQAGSYTVVATNLDGVVTSRVATLTVSQPGPLDRWTWRSPLPQNNTLYHGAFGGDRFVAIGEHGAKLVSLDGGGTWESHNEGVAALGRVAYGNGVFVGALLPYDAPDRTRLPGHFEISTNGIHWTRHSMPVLPWPTGVVKDVAFGNGRFVAACGTEGLLVSSNGVDWERAAWTNSWDLFRVAYGNGIFVVLSGTYENFGTYYGAYYATSSDGLTWSNGNLNADCIVQDITWDHGQFLVCGRQAYPWPAAAAVVTSSDAVSWTAQDPRLNGGIWRMQGTITSVAGGNGKYVALVNGGTYPCLTSVDGIAWHGNGLVPNAYLYSVAFGGGRFAVFGEKGYLATLDDAEVWRVVSAGSPLNLRSVARGNGRYVAVGNDGFALHSSDGVAWARQQLPTSYNLRTVTFGAGGYVAVGEADASGPQVFTSTNGTNWARQNMPYSSGLYGVAYGNGLFVAAGDYGLIVTSTNGADWQLQNSGTDARFNSVTWGGGQFVVVGKRATVNVSSNGVTWSTRSYANLLDTDARYLQGVAYGNGCYVASGKGGTVMVSSNGLDWSIVPSPFAAPYDNEINDVQFGAGRFVASGSSGLIASSTNGVFWTRHLTPCSADLRGACYSDGHFFVGGNDETILQSDFNGPPVLGVPVSASGGVLLSLTAEREQAYRLQCSEDLKTWADLCTLTNLAGGASWLDTNTVARPQRFYRVISP
jgi:hypothetical protein